MRTHVPAEGYGCSGTACRRTAAVVCGTVSIYARVSLPFVFLLEVFVFEASLPEELDVQ